MNKLLCFIFSCIVVSAYAAETEIEKKYKERCQGLYACADNPRDLALADRILEEEARAYRAHLIRAKEITTEEQRDTFTTQAALIRDSAKLQALGNFTVIMANKNTHCCTIC